MHSNKRNNCRDYCLSLKLFQCRRKTLRSEMSFLFRKSTVKLIWTLSLATNQIIIVKMCLQSSNCYIWNMILLNCEQTQWVGLKINKLINYHHVKCQRSLISICCEISHQGYSQCWTWFDCLNFVFFLTDCIRDIAVWFCDALRFVEVSGPELYCSDVLRKEFRVIEEQHKI